MDRINIYTHSSSAFYKILYVFSVSLFMSNEGNEVHLYISSFDLKDEQKKELICLAKEFNSYIHILYIDEKELNKKLERYDKYHFVRKVWNYNTNGMAIYEMIDYLPKDIDRILRLHADSVVLAPLKEIYDIDMTDIAIAGIGGVNSENESIIKSINAEKAIGENFSLYNMKKIRELGITSDNLFETFLDIDSENNIKGYFGGTDYALTKIFNGYIQYFDKYLNYPTFEIDTCKLSLSDRLKYRRKAVMFHYDAKKPWNTSIEKPYPLDDFFWAYARLTPYYRDFIKEKNKSIVRGLLNEFTFLGWKKTYKNKSWYRNRIVYIGFIIITGILNGNFTFLNNVIFGSLGILMMEPIMGTLKTLSKRGKMWE